MWEVIFLIFPFCAGSKLSAPGPDLQELGTQSVRACELGKLLLLGVSGIIPRSWSAPDLPLKTFVNSKVVPQVGKTLSLSNFVRRVLWKVGLAPKISLFCQSGLHILASLFADCKSSQWDFIVEQSKIQMMRWRLNALTALCCKCPELKYVAEKVLN